MDLVVKKKLERVEYHRFLTHHVDEVLLYHQQEVIDHEGEGVTDHPKKTFDDCRIKHRKEVQ